MLALLVFARGGKNNHAGKYILPAIEKGGGGEGGREGGRGLLLF